MVLHKLFCRYFQILKPTRIILIFILFNVIYSESPLYCEDDSCASTWTENIYLKTYGSIKNVVKRGSPLLLKSTNTSNDLKAIAVTTLSPREEVLTHSPTNSATILPENESAFNNINETLDESNPDFFNANESQKVVDHHVYYKSVTKFGIKEVESLWVYMDDLPSDKVKSHGTLSKAYRRALTVTLSFEFPFYGHTLRNVTITTGGFLYTGTFLHKWLAATQYIAPLMANFDTSISENATVKYTDNGTSLTVQWEMVELKDHPEVGSFTFQATIDNEGRIIFAYKDVPLTVKLIVDTEHPVKVGLSDAYIVQKTIFYVRKKTIYEYHKIDMKKDLPIHNWTAIIFDPLPNCVSFFACQQCLSNSTEFNCEWCPRVGRCSDGLDRHRQDWLDGGCEHTAIADPDICASLPPPTSSTEFPYLPAKDYSAASSKQEVPHHAVVGVVVALSIIICLGIWFGYAYFFPHSSSGQFLIKYRPGSWAWRRGEARYTAATMHSIHM